MSVFGTSYSTPRLVAKLLTQSYTAQVNIIEQPGYDWDDLNPIGLHRDPDFLRFNPEFAELQVFDGRLFSGLQLPAGTSDAARQVWEWILADPEAAEWLSGQPDQWDMRVNPRYATVAEKNSSGFPFGDPTPELFPKSDPYCYQAPSTGSFTPPQLCGTDWMPYARSFDEAALRVRAAADFARIAPNPFAADDRRGLESNDAASSREAGDPCADRHVVCAPIRAADRGPQPSGRRQR